MSDLDKKLEEALQPWIDEIQSEYGTGINDDKKPQFIAFANAKLQIKQAFIDDGWASPIEVEKWRRTADTMANLAVDMHSMTKKVYVALDKKEQLGMELSTQSEWEAKAIKDGWVKLPQVTEIVNTDKDTTWEVDFKGLTVNGKIVMTGQEWYDRFTPELERSPMLHHSSVIAAAKKAAGIE